MRPVRDRYTQDYFRETIRALEKIPVNIFLCGRGSRSRRDGARSPSHSDIRAFIKEKLETELKRCDVKLGEHRQLIRAFRRAVGHAGNLADHELALAKRKKMDLVVIFPCSPGSFAELGMFCIADRIAAKMTIFVDRLHRNSNGYVLEGPVKAAQLRKAQVLFVDYSRREEIWRTIRGIVLEAKARKRARTLVIR